MTQDTRRNLLVAGAIALAVLSIVAGMLSRCRATAEPSPEPSETPTTSPSPAESISPRRRRSPPRPRRRARGPGRRSSRTAGTSSTWTRRSVEDGPARVRFDLVYWYTGDEAEEVAAEHGTEATNGYYIENDNPRLRTLPLADEVEVMYVPERLLRAAAGRRRRRLESVLGTAQTDYPEDVPWWITVEGGQITRIEQQFLP